MRSSKLRAGLDKLSGPRTPESEAAPLSGAALASTLDLNEGINRLAEAREIALHQIHPNPHQPRKAFPPETLEALAASIREQGVLQPITVTPDGDGFRIVAGERRWRASQLAGLERIPALVRRLSERDQRIVALMENLQREDLNDMDRARGLADLRDALAAQAPQLSSHQLDEQVGKRLGISGRSVRNFMGLLHLAEPVQEAIAGGSLTEKHGRAIRRLPEPELQERVAESSIGHRLTGEETSAVVAVLQVNPRLEVERLAEQAKSGELLARMKAAAKGSEKGSKRPQTSKEKQESAAGTPSAALDGLLGQLEEDLGRLEQVVVTLRTADATPETVRRMKNSAERLIHLTLLLAGEELQGRSAGEAG